MKKIVLGIMVIVSMGILNGCKSNDPKGVVENYIEAWNSGSIEDVSEYVDIETKKSIEDRLNSCMLSSSNSVLGDKLKAYKKEMNKLWREHNPFDALDKVTKTSKNFKQDLKKIARDRSLNHNDKTLQMGLLMLKQTDIYSKEKSKVSPVAYKMFAFTFANKVRAESGDFLRAVGGYEKYEYFKSLVLADMKANDSDNIEKIEEKCIDRIFHPNTIDEANIIEVEDLSVDNKKVKVELLYKDNRSSKTYIMVEKIAGQWLVTTPL